LIESFKSDSKPGRQGQGGLKPHLNTKNLGRQEIFDVILELDTQMKAAAAELQFELAARLRDEIADLKRDLRDYDRHA
jgi:excinuclease ABC subunit B